VSKKKTAAAMDLKRFWDIIAASCDPDPDMDDWLDTWYGPLVDQLARLPPEDIVAFDLRFDELTSAVYNVDLWGAAYLINGGCSDDGFYYFRCWLVGMGKKVYEAALANPDSLADIVDPGRDDYEAEIYSVPVEAWRQSTGRDDEEFYAERERLSPRSPVKLKGRRWDYDDDAQVRKRLPRLAALYLREDEESDE
jgi:hypothetical protein